MVMSTVSLISLPRELIYLVFRYLNQEQVVYSFLELNDQFTCLVKHFLRGKFHFGNTTTQIISEYCLFRGLPSFGRNLFHLSIAYPYRLSTYIQILHRHCPYLSTLSIYCRSQHDDIRLYLVYFLHRQLVSLTFQCNGEIVGKNISRRLLQTCDENPFLRSSQLSMLVLHLSSTDDLYWLKRYSESTYLPDGLYTIECMATGEWLTDSGDDLCLTSVSDHLQSIFVVQQWEGKPYCLEYELRNEQTCSSLTVLKCNEEEEHWIRSSILSAQRKQSARACSRFTFERADDPHQFYIRPSYLGAKRLQALGSRIITSLCENDNASNHRFKLHRIA